MMRALWTAASGMKAQQLNVDVISNNLSNVNTTGYKKQRLEFKDLLYETLSRADVYEDQGRPVNMQVGHGVAPVSTVTTYTMGSLEKTDNPLDLAIDGEGFFAVRNAKGEIVYTRDGSFKISIGDGETRLVTSEGYAVLDDAGNDIILTGININQLTIGPSGELQYIDADNQVVPLGQTLQIVQFNNRDGLLKVGSNFVIPTPASGEPIPETEVEKRSVVMQGYLESSNVQVVEEIVKLIIAQRAYEINSKSIQTADEMLGMANNLRR
ncbi:MAG: flagellar basal-body rod protein FlgG [Clostridiaceae bacterium]|nr:flagellar basal-body rod protein FlgG [Clostridiaceae bacterium]